MPPSREDIKAQIRAVFNENVRGRRADLTGYNRRHDGAHGDWLTKAMGLTVNGRNEPDMLGFEMKKQSPKITFGDWSPTRSLFGRGGPLSRNDFLRAFGDDPSTLGRYSWSGKVFPRVNHTNLAGQTMAVLDNSDIIARYDYTRDLRGTKDADVPKHLRVVDLALASWEHGTMRSRVENKFNQLGWFKCLTDSSGIYTTIKFGKPITFETFIMLVRTGDVFLDCGMYQGNPRPYMNWRASSAVWDRLAE